VIDSFKGSGFRNGRGAGTAVGSFKGSGFRNGRGAGTAVGDFSNDSAPARIDKLLDLAGVLLEEGELFAVLICWDCFPLKR
jgi:hypothetical protein